MKTEENSVYKVFTAKSGAQFIC